MSKTFDLSTLNLSAGTHEITVKARASGYADSPASNAVSYVVEGDTVQVSGTWRFNDIPTFIGSRNIKVNFTSFGGSYRTIHIYDSTSGRFMNYRDTDAGIDKRAYTEGEGWRNESFRTITFDGVQTVSKEFYDWLVANAVQQIFAFHIEGGLYGVWYDAEVGMTWAEWIDSTYNTGGIYTDGDYVYRSNHTKISYTRNDYVRPTETIIANYRYRVGSTHGGGSS